LTIFGGFQMIRIVLALIAASMLFSGAVAQELSAREQKILNKIVAFHQNNRECDGRGSDMQSTEFIRFRKKKDYESDTIVVLVTCSFHAYQVSWVAYMVYDDGAEPEISILSFPVTDDGKQFTASKFLMSPDWDPVSKSINTFTKGRGMADCGDYETYRWNGYAFYLVSVNSQTCCWNDEDFEKRPECKKIKDIYPIPDYEWPLVYAYKGKK